MFTRVFLCFGSFLELFTFSEIDGPDFLTISLKLKQLVLKCLSDVLRTSLTPIRQSDFRLPLFPPSMQIGPISAQKSDKDS